MATTCTCSGTASTAGQCLSRITYPALICCMIAHLDREACFTHALIPVATHHATATYIRYGYRSSSPEQLASPKCDRCRQRVARSGGLSRRLGVLAAPGADCLVES